MKHLPVIRPEKGFTLLEVLIVLFIASILAAIATPSFLGLYRRSQLNDAVTNIRGALQTSQREAMRQSSSCSFNLDTSTDPVTVKSCIDRTQLPTSVSIPSGDVTISFGFQGNTNNPNTIRIASDALNEEKCLVISMPLGMIREGIYDSSATPKCQKP